MSRITYKGGLALRATPQKAIVEAMSNGLDAGKRERPDVGQPRIKVKIVAPGVAVFQARKKKVAATG